MRRLVGDAHPRRRPALGDRPRRALPEGARVPLPALGEGRSKTSQDLSAQPFVFCGPWKVGANCWPQNPQKTNGCALRSWEVLLCDPVERLNGIGRAPMLAVAAGGQSWLVGKAAPSDAELPGVQGWPAFGPAWQVVGVPAQRGHGMSPSVGPVR